MAVKTINKLEILAKEIKLLTLEISYMAKTGHIGSCFSIAELLTVLYFNKMNFSKKNVNDKSRDRFILSKGHSAAILYSILFKKEILSKKELFTFGQDEKGLCEHPEISQKGVEMTTGSLGHGLAYATGIALANKKLKNKGNVYVLISDGECGEGSIWEAAAFASRMKLNNLIVILDYNNWQCFGKTSDITNLEPIISKWKDFGFETLEVNGHKISEVLRAFAKLPHKNKPSIVIAHTIAGNGLSIMENQQVAHYKALSEDEYLKSIKEIKI